MVEAKHRNSTKTTTSLRVKIPSKLKAPAPIERQNSKPTPIVTYEEDNFTPLSVDTEKIHRGRP